MSFGVPDDIAVPSCYTHTTTPARTQCSRCHRRLCDECVAPEVPSFCRSCAEVVQIPAPPAKQAEIRAARLRDQTLAWLMALPGLGLYLHGIVRIRLGGAHDSGLGVTLLGLLLLVSGLGFYAKSKGQSIAWGGLAVVGCIGVAIAALLQRKCRHCGVASGYAARTCPTCDAPV